MKKISIIYIVLAIVPTTVYPQPLSATYVQVYSDGKWSGTILDSGYDSQTVDGNVNRKIHSDCDYNGIYSVAFQKQDTSGFLTIRVYSNSVLVDEGTTTAEYGIVTLSGRCS